jgi:hypothetical protein
VAAEIPHWHPAMARAFGLLAERAPIAAARAGAALASLLGWTRHSAWPNVVWDFSELTGDGFPVEFAFSSADSALRYTAEVAGPEVDDRARLPIALQWLDQREPGALPAATAELFGRLQSAGALRYGAWISGRHDDRRDRHKLYLEVPDPLSEAARDLTRNLLGAEALLERRASQLRMVGYDPAVDRIELYFRADGLELWEAARALHRVGLADGEKDLWALIAEACDRPLRNRLPGGRAGFSLSFDAGRQPASFTIFHHAVEVFGGDGSIRARVLALAKSRGWNFDLYEALSAPLMDRATNQTDHTMVGFTIARQSVPALQIGLRPPETGET